MGVAVRNLSYPLGTFRRELLRKSIHLTIALVPMIARWNMALIVILLSSGILFYVVCEISRINGRANGIVARMTLMALRPTERGFVWGPVTLGLGALATLLYYPAPAAIVAVYALAFGDGLAGLAGRLWGRRSSFRIGEKTVPGSTACFLATFVATYMVLHNVTYAVLTAVVVTLLELIPLSDTDNLIIPLGTGFFVTLMTQIH